MSEKKKRDESVLLTQQDASRERLFFWAVTLLLFFVGVYQSILLYGHQIVPNSDFPGFYRAGKAILSFELPGSFKRAPVTGMLQVLATNLVSGGYQDLKAGWLVNAILHPFNLVLMWLVARRIIGNSARWLAVIIAANTWILYLLTEPIAETTYLFFILLTVLFIFKRSSWAYLLAAITTMVRYEAGALILAAFVIDMIYADNKKQRLLALGYSALASVPLIFWMIQTAIHSDPNSTGYFTVFKMSSSKAFQGMEDKIGFGKHFKLIWYTGYSNLFSVSLKSSKEAYESLANFTKFFAVLTFCLGILYSLIRKKWEILVLMIFLVPYFVAHAYYPYPIPRFHHTTFWIALIISFYGVIEFWRTLSGNGRIPRFVVMTMQITFIIGMLIWAVMIWKNLGLCADACPKVASLPYVLLGVSALLAVAYVLCHNFKGKLREFTVLTLMAVVLVSNQLSVASLMRGGNRDAEFKMLADWYSENAEKGEGLATSLASVVKIYVKKGKIVNYRDVQVGSLEEFVDYMDKRDVKYIAWDSRLGLAPKDPYYKLYGLDVIKPLVQPVDRGRLKFVKRFENGKRFINLFEIQDGESVN